MRVNIRPMARPPDRPEDRFYFELEIFGEGAAPPEDGPSLDFQIEENSMYIGQVV